MIPLEILLWWFTTGTFGWLLAEIGWQLDYQEHLDFMLILLAYLMPPVTVAAGVQWIWPYYRKWRNTWISAKKSDAIMLNQNDPNASRGLLPNPSLLQNMNQLSSLLASVPVLIEGPILGYRAFTCTWTDEGYKLHSVVVGCVWDGPVMQDEYGPTPSALTFPYAVQKRIEGLGFFSVRSLDSAKLSKYGDKRPHPTIVRAMLDNVLALGECSVLAQVECFGNIVEHQDGWRSQGQSIQRLYVSCADVMADLERRYQCEVEVRPDLFPWFASEPH